MSAFCSRYPECGCVGVGTKCYSDAFLNAHQARKLADIEAALQLDEIVKTEKGPSRNRPCPCGSGKKFKHCCAK